MIRIVQSLVFLTIVLGVLPGYLLTEVFFAHIYNPDAFPERLKELGLILLISVPSVWLIQKLLDRFRPIGMTWITPKNLARTTAVIVWILLCIYGKQLWFAVPRIPDSIVYCFQAKIFAAGRLWAPVPDSLAHFDYMFTLVKDGMYVSRYSPGFPLLLALGYTIHAPWMVCPFFAAGCILLFFKLCCLMYGSERLSAAASVFLSASPFFLGVSGQVLTHAPALFFFCSSLIFGIESYRSGKSSQAFLGGLSMGAFFIIRQLSALALLTPFVLYFLYRYIKLRKRALVMSLGAGMLICGFIQGSYNYFWTGNPASFPFHSGEFGHLDRMGFHHRVKWDIWPEPGDNNPIHTPEKALRNTHLNISQLNLTLFGWPAGLCFIPLAFLIRPVTGRKWDWLLLSGVLLMMGGYACYWFPGAGLVGPRYFYEGLTGFVFLTLRGMVNLTRLISDSRWKKWALFPWIFAIISSVHGAFCFWPEHVELNFEAFGQPFGRLFEYVDTELKQPSIVFITGDTTTYSIGFFANDIDLSGRIIYARDLGPRKNAALLNRMPGRIPFLYVAGELHSDLIPMERSGRLTETGMSCFQKETVVFDNFSQLDAMRWKKTGRSRDSIHTGDSVIHVKGMLHPDMAPGSTADLRYLELPFARLTVSANFRAVQARELLVSLILENGRYLDEFSELAIAAVQFFGPSNAAGELPFYAFNTKGFGNGWRGNTCPAAGDEDRRFHRLEIHLDPDRSEAEGLVDGRFLGKAVLPYRSSVVKVRLSVFHDGTKERPADVEWDSFQIEYRDPGNIEFPAHRHLSRVEHR